MSFTHYTPFAVAASQVQNGPLSNFPVVLKPTLAQFKTIANGGHVADDDGFDIRPHGNNTATDPLDFELIPGTYDPTTGTFEMWVRVPSLDDGSEIFLFCGDSSLTADGSSTTTWRSEYKAVLHLGDGSTLSAANSSQTSMSPTNNGVVATAGKLAGGGDGASSRNINLGTVSALNITSDITLSVWIKTIDGTAQVLIGGYNGSNIGYGLLMGLGVSGALALFASGGPGAVEFTSGSLNDGEWHLGHAVVDGSTYRLYTDGAASGNGAYGPPGSYSGDRKVFSHVDDNLYWTGDMDEIRIYAGALSADWIATEFNNQDDPDAFFDVGAEQAASLFKVGSLFALFQ